MKKQKQETKYTPKILYFDIEASDLAANKGTLLCIGYKWGHEKKVHMLSLRDFPGRYRKAPWDDKLLLKSFRSVIEEADVVVHQFGDYYDIPFLNTRCVEHAMKPFSFPAASIDTCRISWKHLRMSRNSLQQLGDLVQRRDKEEDRIRKTPLELTTWLLASRGDVKSLKEVEHHCNQDILVLEKIYKGIAPFMKNHPNLSRIFNGRACPVCQSHRVRKNGINVAARTVSQKWQCLVCGHSYATPLSAADRKDLGTCVR